MSDQKHKIFVCEPLGEDGLRILNNHQAFVVDVALGLSNEELKARVGEYDALLVRSQTQVNDQIINAGRKLKLIGRAGVGIDNIDIACAEKNGIAVINTPSGNSVSTAEFAFALMMNLARNISFAHKDLARGQWQRSKFAGCELERKTLGIIGFGNVGRQLALRAQAFKMEVIATDPQVDAATMAEYGVKRLSFDQLLAQGDFISLHCGLSKDTKNLINSTSIARMKKGSMIINTARGELIDNNALLESLDAKHLAAAAIDVYSVEPPHMDDPLLKHPQVLCTPHLGASTKEAQSRVASLLAEQTIAFFSGSKNLSRIV